MGEIADMMLDGTLCECCGCYIEGDGDGIPRYCSPQCAADRGAPVVRKQGKHKKVSKKQRRRERKSTNWSTVMQQVTDFATQNDLSLEPRNPQHPHYELARLRGCGADLIVYPHTSTTGNQHARIRNNNSQDADYARHLMVLSGFKFKTLP